MVLGNSLPPIVDVAPTAALAPRILWPTMVLGDRGYIEDDLEFFPEKASYYERLKLGIGGAMSSAFRSAVRVARQRVWLLDEQLLRDDQSRDRLGELFYETGASDLRIVTASKEGATERAQFLRELEPDLRAHALGTPPRIRIYLNFNKSVSGVPEVHDRFAIIDDVLWHCGATIGGMHNQINAMTYGWSALKTRAVDFFEDVCKLLEEHDGRAS
jgi:hypothetical protein